MDVQCLSYYLEGLVVLVAEQPASIVYIVCGSDVPVKGLGSVPPKFSSSSLSSPHLAWAPSCCVVALHRETSQVCLICTLHL